MISLRAGSATDTGLVRSNNQDQYLIAPPLYAVADGMGGHAAGEVASLTAVDALRDAFTSAATAAPEELAEAARAANRAVWDKAQGDPELRGMGTTLVAVALTEQDGRPQLAVINVGDSRVYLLRDDQLVQLTNDHSLVAELVSEGQLKPEEAEFHPQRHVLTRALGVDAEVGVDLTVLDPVPGDRLLLCSDGLVREVGDEQVASLLRRLADPGDVSRELVNEAKLRGGSDNITVVVVDVIGEAEDELGKDAPRAPLPPPLSEPAPAEASAEARPPRAPKARLVTFRVVLFVVVLLAVVAAAIGGTAYYARSSYFVGLRGDRVTIFQGRPGGVLWFHPTVAATTGVTTATVPAERLPALEAGQEEASLAAARLYVQRLQQEYASYQKANSAPTTTIAGSTTSSTTSPSTSTPGTT